jgi:signal transduction histidine kinase
VSAPANAPLTDVRAAGWRLPMVLGAIVVLDEILALGALGVAPRGGVPLTARLLAGFVSVAVISGVLVVARWTWLAGAAARARDWPTIVTVVIAAQVGVAAGTALLVDRGLIGDGTAAGELRGTGLDAVLFLTATTFVVLAVLGAVERHRLLSARLSATGEELQVAYTRSVDAVASERARLAEQVRGLLEERLGPTSLRPALFTPERLREVADATLRPLAHQLARPAGGTGHRSVVPSRRTAVLRVLRGLRAVPVLHPRILAATMFLLTFRFSIGPPSDAALRPDAGAGGAPGAGAGPTVTLSVDWASFTQSILLHAGTVVVVLVGARLLARRLTRTQPPMSATLTRDWGVTFAGLTVLGLASLTLLRLVHALPGLSELPHELPPVNATVALGFTAPLLLITVVTSVLPAAEAALTRLRDDLAAVNRELEQVTARTNALLDHERRLFARHLHASVQASVNAASLVIERASQDGDVDPEVLDRAAALIDTAVERLTDDATSGGHVERDGPADLAARIEAIVATWEGLAACEVTLDAAARSVLEGDTVARATTCDLIAEACANAVIHAHASTVRVHVEADGGDGADGGGGVGSDGAAASRELRLVVHDDGDLPDAQRSDGLGSRILTASTTSWTLEHDEHGTTLRATLPVR